MGESTTECHSTLEAEVALDTRGRIKCHSRPAEPSLLRWHCRGFSVESERETMCACACQSTANYSCCCWGKVYPVRTCHNYCLQSKRLCMSTEVACFHPLYTVCVYLQLIVRVLIIILVKTKSWLHFIHYTANTSNINTNIFQLKLILWQCIQLIESSMSYLFNYPWVSDLPSLHVGKLVHSWHCHRTGSLASLSWNSLHCW